jgi:hypothetical protein
MRFRDSGRARLRPSRRGHRLAGRLALPESCKAIECPGRKRSRKTDAPLLSEQVAARAKIGSEPSPAGALVQIDALPLAETRGKQPGKRAQVEIGF